MTVWCAGLDETAVSSKPAHQTVWHIPDVVLIQLIFLMMDNGCPKHVENRNKHIWKRIVRQVGYLQTLQRLENVHFVGICCTKNKPLRTGRPIYRTGVPLSSWCCILYIYFSKNISAGYFKHAAHSPFFSSECRFFHNATFFWFLYYSHFTYRVC
jgi:hypothetical protein